MRCGAEPHGWRATCLACGSYLRCPGIALWWRAWMSRIIARAMEVSPDG